MLFIRKKKKNTTVFSQRETSGITHNYSVRIKAYLAVPYGKSFPIMRIREDLPQSFHVFNSENMGSKTCWEQQVTWTY